MSENKGKAMGSKENGVVYNVNNDALNPDINYNSGKSGIVVMKDGKAQLVNQGSDIERGVPTKEELQAKKEEEEGFMAVRVMQLPDPMDREDEEREIPVIRKESPKQITRVDVKVGDDIKT